MRRGAPLFLLLALGCPKAQDPRPPPPSGKGTAGNTKIQSFSKAKRTLEKVHANHRTTLYCGCRFDEKKQVDHQSCGYKVRKDKKRAQRIEWEHVVPAHAFGQSLEAWRKGHPDCASKGRPYKGRRCAEKVSEKFRLMQADMYNLHPAIGEVNGRRSNYAMAEIPGEPREFGDCDVEIQDRKVEPRPQIRGLIARAYQYMDGAYPGMGIISKKNRKLFEAWAKQHPPDRWECERAQRIEKLQGNPNEVLRAACAQH